MTLLPVPGGSFFMGENPSDKFANDTERPRHMVTVERFEMAEFPVTVGEFRVFSPGHEPDASRDWPAVMVSWEEAVAFCEWLGPGHRLPSEAEWEFAARAGTQTPFPWGDDISPTRANYLYSEQGAKVGPGHRTPRGTYPANAFGLQDLCGNVCEWVSDSWRPSYHAEPLEAPALRTLRGGAWDYLPRLLRVSWRDRFPQNQRRDNIGFRVARTP